MRNNIILTIGMIVKNEGKVLERCLDSLVPLMKKVKCELIITDTGSTDSSIEIAQKYTSNVIHFKWISDFSAARNTALENANGEWFFFIDADEYLDSDINSMVSFFCNEKKNSNYNWASICIRNYYNNEITKYSDIRIPRFHKLKGRSESVKFVGKIHETIPIKGEGYNLNTILHHTGYYYETEEQVKNKSKRNLEIMYKELEKNKNDLRLVLNIIISELDDNKKEKYINIAFDMLSSNPKNVNKNAVFIHAIRYYFRKRDYTKVIDLCDEFKNKNDYLNTVSSITVLMMYARTLMIIEEFDKALEVWNDYFNVFELYKKNKINTDDQLYGMIYGLSREEYAQCQISKMHCLQTLDRIDELSITLIDIDRNFLNYNDYCHYVDFYHLICLAKKDFSFFTGLFENFEKLDEGKKLYVYSVLEKQYYSVIHSRYVTDLIENCFYKSSVRELKAFSNIIRNTADIAENDVNEYILFNKFLVSEVIHVALKKNIYMIDALYKYSPEETKVIFAKISSIHSDYAAYLALYQFNETNSLSVTDLYIICEMFEAALISDLQDEKVVKEFIYNKYILYITELTSKLYNSKDELDIELDDLPENHRFGIIISQAYAELNENNLSGYIRCLQKALMKCSTKTEVIRYLLNKLKDALNT